MSRKFLARQRGLDPGHGLTRRNIVTGAAGVAAAGAAGAFLIDGATPALASPAASSAALAAQDTTVEAGGLAPSVVNLADAATIVVDASAGNDFRVTIAGNRTMGTPASPANGQQAIFQVTQGPGGPFTLAWSSGYEFAASLPQPTLSTDAGQLDILAFTYNGARATWLFVGSVNGFG
jgi:hypothetical protein